VFPNFWQPEYSGDAWRRAWKQSGLRQTLNATVSKVDNLVWLPLARKNENWSRGPTVDEFCQGPVLAKLRFYGDPGLTKVLPPNFLFLFLGPGCPPKIGDPRLTQRGPRVDLRQCAGNMSPPRLPPGDRRHLLQDHLPHGRTVAGAGVPRCAGHGHGLACRVVRARARHACDACASESCCRCPIPCPPSVPC
jgi:hypothetical protein